MLYRFGAILSYWESGAQGEFGKPFTLGNEYEHPFQTLPLMPGSLDYTGPRAGLISSTSGSSTSLLDTPAF